MRPTVEQPWTLGRLLDWTTAHFREKKSEFPRLDAEVLLAHAQGCKRIELYTRFEETATEDVRSRFRDLVRKRTEGCPVAYLVGKKEFFSLELEVNPAVLIPRPDTETLVMACLEAATPQAAILDVGTGSGAIAIAIAKKRPTVQVTAIDLSSEALDVARRNAAKHKVESRIRFLQGDLFAPLAADDSFDIILSNPPYIPTATIATLEPGVRDFEPRLALDGGPDGFQMVTRLIEKAGQHLKLGGCLLLEIGVDQEKPVRRLLEQAGYRVGPSIKDHSGHPRVLKAGHPR